MKISHKMEVDFLMECVNDENDSDNDVVALELNIDQIDGNRSFDPVWLILVINMARDILPSCVNGIFFGAFIRRLRHNLKLIRLFPSPPFV